MGLSAIISLEVYPFDILLSYGESDCILKKRLIELGIPKNEIKHILNMGTASGRFVLFSNNASVIRLVEFNEKSAAMSVLAHEVFHAVAAIMGIVGMGLLSHNNEEAYAYVIEFIVRKASEVILSR